MLSFLQIWSHLLKKFLMKNLIFCAVSFKFFENRLLLHWFGGQASKIQLALLKFNVRLKESIVPTPKYNIKYPRYRKHQALFEKRMPTLSVV